MTDMHQQFESDLDDLIAHYLAHDVEAGDIIRSLLDVVDTIQDQSDSIVTIQFVDLTKH